MSQVKVPDIGDFTDVPVIEVLVAVGDEVVAEQGLVTLESDKATMEVPAPHAGVVEELLVEEGDEVSEGTPVAVISEGSADDGGGKDADGQADGADQVRARPSASPPPRRRTEAMRPTRRSTITATRPEKSPAVATSTPALRYAGSPGSEVLT